MPDTIPRTMPKRIQRKRTKGWRMPPGAISVVRPGIFGNPFDDASYGRAQSVALYRIWLTTDLACDLGFGEDQAAWLAERRAEILAKLPALRGKTLACWCPIISQDTYCPCHADVLLSIANDIPMAEVICENTRRARLANR